MAYKAQDVNFTVLFVIKIPLQILQFILYVTPEVQQFDLLLLLLLLLHGRHLSRLQVSEGQGSLKLQILLLRLIPFNSLTST